MSNRNYDPNNPYDPYNSPMPDLPPEGQHPQQPDDDLLRQITRSSGSVYDVGPQERYAPPLEGPAYPDERRPQAHLPISTTPTCAKCGGSTLRARSAGGDRSFRLVPLDSFVGMRSSTVSAIVCRKCGFTEVYADAPGELEPGRGLFG